MFLSMADILVNVHKNPTTYVSLLDSCGGNTASIGFVIANHLKEWNLL